MSIQLYENNIYISTKQLDKNDIKAVNQLNIKSIICNRYDDEEINQPKFLETKKLLLENGINNIIQQPIYFSTINMQDALKLEKYLQNLPKPILLYCKTGTRSIFLISIINAYHGVPLQKILTKAEDLFYNFKPHKNFFESIIKLYKKS